MLQSLSGYVTTKVYFKAAAFLYVNNILND